MDTMRDTDYHGSMLPVAMFMLRIVFISILEEKIRRFAASLPIRPLQPGSMLYW